LTYSTKYQKSIDLETKELKSKLELLESEQIESKVKLSKVSEGIEEMAENLKKDFEGKISLLDNLKIKGLQRKITLNEDKLRETESITKEYNQKLSQRIEEIGGT
jgi:hypothetical protein